jgi:hypothetical protein
LNRFNHAGGVVVATRFEQQHADIFIFGQPPRHHRTRRSGSTNDEIVVGPEVRTELPLIGFHGILELS